MEKFRRKIEALARRPETEEEPEPVSECPCCGFKLPASMLDCPSCHNSLPFCTVTGMHVVVGDLTLCPHCKFPATHSAFVQLLASQDPDLGGGLCPMCNKAVAPGDVRKLSVIEAQNWTRLGGVAPHPATSALVAAAAGSSSSSSSSSSAAAAAAAGGQGELYPDGGPEGAEGGIA